MCDASGSSHRQRPMRDQDLKKQVKTSLIPFQPTLQSKFIFTIISTIHCHTDERCSTDNSTHNTTTINGIRHILIVTTTSKLVRITHLLLYFIIRQIGCWQRQNLFGSATKFNIINSMSDRCYQCLGALQSKKIPKIRVDYESGWVGPGLNRNFVCGKLSKNSPKQVLIFWSSIPCVFCLYSGTSIIRSPTGLGKMVR